MPKIVFTIDKTGKVQAEGQGFKGKTCNDAMAPFKDALGVETARKDKPEYNGSGVSETVEVKK